MIGLGARIKIIVNDIQEAYRGCKLRTRKGDLKFLVEKLYGIKSVNSNLLSFLFFYNETFHVQIIIYIFYFLPSLMASTSIIMFLRTKIHVLYEKYSNKNDISIMVP